MVPAGFRALHAEGRFDAWGAPYHSLSDAQRAALLPARQRLALWLHDVEWDLAPDEVGERDHLRPDVHVFAGNGCGDLYAIYPPWQRGAAEPPVLFCPHDGPPATVFARSFGEALVRWWLDTGIDGALPAAERDELLRGWAAMITPHLDESPRVRLATALIDLSPAALTAARAALIAALPRDQLEVVLPPTRYDPDHVTGDLARRLYAASIASYEALIAEGHPRFATELAAARANRAAALPDEP